MVNIKWKYSLNSAHRFSDPDDDVVSTSTVIAMSQLEIQDVIYVTTSMEKNHGESKIVSTVYKNILFIGQKISD